nr:unnamed protein product [Callosobruchus chinensis]
MGDLPKERVTPCRPFLNAGIDFCGPFSIKDKKTRKYNVTKGYVCLFVCMATKALHLELATELTSEAFLACLHRFFARRGKSLHLYTDNGSNFIAANKELRNFLKHNSNKFNDSLGRDDITLYKVQIRRSLEYCSHIWGAAAPTTLSILDAVQRRAIRPFGDPALTRHLQPLSHRRAVGDLPFFYRYSNRFCFSELTSLQAC